MKSEAKIRNRDLFMDVVRRPKEQKSALVWTAVSGALVAVGVILELFK